MKYQPLFGKKEKSKKNAPAEVDVQLLDTEVQLRSLKTRYQVLLQRELQVARNNKSLNIQDPDNYAKIGIAYYSLNIVDTVQKQLRSIKSQRELYLCMNEMSSALNLLRNLNGKTGKVDAGSMLKAFQKLQNKGNSSDKSLQKALEMLSQTEIKTQEGGSGDALEALVSKDLIERLIAGEDVEKCLKQREGLMSQTEDLLSVFAESDGQVNLSESSAEQITNSIDELINLL